MEDELGSWSDDSKLVWPLRPSVDENSVWRTAMRRTSAKLVLESRKNHELMYKIKKLVRHTEGKETRPLLEFLARSSQHERTLASADLRDKTYAIAGSYQITLPLFQTTKARPVIFMLTSTSPSWKRLVH